MMFDSYRRRILYQISILPFAGRNMYERLNSRLDRQIKIRTAKKVKASSKKTKNLFGPEVIIKSRKQLFFDSK